MDPSAGLGSCLEAVGTFSEPFGCSTNHSMVARERKMPRHMEKAGMVPKNYLAAKVWWTCILRARRPISVSVLGSYPIQYSAFEIKFGGDM